MLTYLPQKGVLSHLYLPADHDVPAGGETRILGFSFPNTPAAETVSASEVVREDFLLYAMTVLANPQAAPIRMGWVLVNGRYVWTQLPWSTNGAATVMLYHGHGGVQRQLLHQPTNPVAFAGSGGNPMILGETYLIERGDTVTCEVANAFTVTQAGQTHYDAADIYLALWGIQVPR